MNKHIRTILTVALICVAATTSAYAGGDPEDSGSAVYIDNEGYAAGGADVVAYHSLDSGAPAVMGDPDYSYTWRGATWLFSSQANLDMFEENPERYAPAYGGYCSWAMARDKLAPIDPDRWNVVDGTLYLNYNKKTQREFEAELEQQIGQADAFWVEKRAELISESDS